MAYPSTISALSTPQPSDTLNNPSHSGLHQNENTAITEIETFVGTLSSNVGTLVYDIRSANSNGGGHVQSADKGGTGQTSYTKGDLLVAQSTSVLTKLAVSADGNVLVADSSQATGVKWGAAAATNIYTAASIVSSITSNIETQLFAASILGSTLGTNKAVRYTAYLDRLAVSTSNTFTVKAYYGSNAVASVVLNTTAGQALPVGPLIIQGYIVNKSSSSQYGVMNATYGTVNTYSPATTSIFSMYSPLQTASVESGGLQQISLTYQFINMAPANSIMSGLFIVEKIA